MLPTPNPVNTQSAFSLGVNQPVKINRTCIFPVIKKLATWFILIFINTHLIVPLLGNWFFPETKCNKVNLAEAFAFQILSRGQVFYSLVDITLSFQVFLIDQMVWDLFNCSPGIIVFLLVHFPKAALCERAGGICHLGPVVTAVDKN